jgi:hypothetical protein
MVRLQLLGCAYTHGCNGGLRVRRCAMDADRQPVRLFFQASPRGKQPAFMDRRRNGHRTVPLLI